MRECCREIQAEVVSKSSNKIHQTSFSRALYSALQHMQSQSLFALAPLPCMCFGSLQSLLWTLKIQQAATERESSRRFLLGPRPRRVWSSVRPSGVGRSVHVGESARIDGRSGGGVRSRSLPFGGPFDRERTSSNQGSHATLPSHDSKTSHTRDSTCGTINKGRPQNFRDF